MSSKERWILPTTVFNLINGLAEVARESDESIKRKREYGKVRESWIAAVFLIRKTLTENKVWYLRKNSTENSIDDIYARPFTIKDGKVWSEVPISIQAFQIMEKSPDIKSALENKFKDDLRNVSLVGYIIRDDQIDWADLHRWINKKQILANDVHIVAKVMPNTYTVFQIYPNLNFTEFSLNLCILNSRPIVEAEEVHDPNKSAVFKIGESLITPSLDVIDIPRPTSKRRS